MLNNTSLLALLITLALPLQAEKRALLIGIGTYGDPRLEHLDGPASDIQSMKDLLVNRFGFTDVRTLIDSQATRAAILQQLDQLRSRTRPGDYVVYYYSGHGTSHFDPGASDWGLDPNTGAALPFDIRIGQPAQVTDQLIIGKRDLLPVFSQIDRTATLFAIFDTCYSADAAKSSRRAASRYVRPDVLSPTRSTPKRDLDDDIAAAGADKSPSPFPYQHVISLAAAGKFETAGDLPAEESFDKRPHGAFTEALLRGMLQGEADKNHDGRISHDELYDYLQERAANWKNKPVLQAAAGADGLLASAAFDAPPRPASPAAPSDSAPLPAGADIRVKADGLDAAMTERIRRLPRIDAVSSGAFDLLVRRVPAGFDLFDSSGLAISDASLSEQALLARVAAQPRIRDLVDLAYPQQFNVSLRMHPDTQSAWFDGQVFNFSARTDRQAFLLLLNIDVTGAVTVVYPFREAAAAVPAARNISLGGSDHVTPPLGVEYMKLFAFAIKPADYDHWIAGANEPPRTVEPASDEFQRLMHMLQSTSDGRAETRLRILTTPRPSQ